MLTGAVTLNERGGGGMCLVIQSGLAETLPVRRRRGGTDLHMASEASNGRNSHFFGISDLSLLYDQVSRHLY